MFLLLYAFTFHATWAAAWVYPAEISYANERAKKASFAVAAHFGGAAVLVGIMALVLQWSIAGAMFLFDCGNFVSFGVVFFFAVETKNQTIDTIVSDFGRLQPCGCLFSNRERARGGEESTSSFGYTRIEDLGPQTPRDITITRSSPRTLTAALSEASNH